MMAKADNKPVAGVSICVIRGDRVLLVKRANRMAFGLWSLPGGHVELGETVKAAALRELAEETAIEAEVVRLLDCIDIIHRSPAGDVEAHFILNIFGARWLAGEARAGSDAADVRWSPLDALEQFKMTPGTADLIRRAMPLLAQGADA